MKKMLISNERKTRFCKIDKIKSLCHFELIGVHDMFTVSPIISGRRRTALSLSRRFFEETLSVVSPDLLESTWKQNLGFLNFQKLVFLNPYHGHCPRYVLVRTQIEGSCCIPKNSTRSLKTLTVCE